MGIDEEILEFNRARDEALLSLDEAKIRDLAKRYNAESMPSNPKTFWASVHKARTGCKTLPMYARKLSKQWLTERGLKSLDDGDL